MKMYTHSKSVCCTSTNIYSFFEKKIFGMVVVLIHHLIVGLLPIAVAVFFSSAWFLHSGTPTKISHQSMGAPNRVYGVQAYLCTVNAPHCGTRDANFSFIIHRQRVLVILETQPNFSKIGLNFPMPIYQFQQYSMI